MTSLSASSSLRTLATWLAASAAVAILGAVSAWVLMPNSILLFAQDSAGHHTSRFLILGQATQNGENNGAQEEQESTEVEQKGAQGEKATCAKGSSIAPDVGSAIASFRSTCILMIRPESSDEAPATSKSRPAASHEVSPGREGGRDGP